MLRNPRKIEIYGQNTAGMFTANTNHRSESTVTEVAQSNTNYTASVTSDTISGGPISQLR